ncbi:Hypothetical protein P9215_13031 [Prochlorococcus marinus str. MIT 9215]|uniref:Uncharacterized protein n=1 Tax=Prochlorococcus marinus (strain MIT 9215) TaxID=93060 RepID=A8G5N7_PROM2|nr:Hypothetical protein P9215_13031 [Prochlorococcus marinus str. MIT 9215]
MIFENIFGKSNNIPNPLRFKKKKVFITKVLASNCISTIFCINDLEALGHRFEFCHIA